jgi:hypothetical protein
VNIRFACDVGQARARKISGHAGLGKKTFANLTSRELLPRRPERNRRQRAERSDELDVPPLELSADAPKAAANS